ncbi:MAG: translation initiation factor IF-1 [Mycoplasmataceae bacterium]|nr:translation initiation factor IF-1 [Mycoplasmataceae bacterium]
MANDTIKMDGIVKEVFPNSTYKVELENKIIINAVLSGKMWQHHIQILKGDKVTVELSPYDLTKGRITYRN